MNPQACDGNGSHDEQQQQQHLSNNNKESSIIGGSSANTNNPKRSFLTPATTTPDIFRIGLMLYDLKCVSKTDAIAIRAITNPASSCQLVAMSVIESNETTTGSDTTTCDREMQARQWLSQNIPTSFYEYCIPEVNNNVNNNNINNNINRMSLNTPNAAAAAAHNSSTSQCATAFLSTSSSAAKSSSANFINTMPLHFGVDGYHKMLQDGNSNNNDDKDKDKDDQAATTTIAMIDGVYIIGLASDPQQSNTYVLQALRSNKHVLLNDPRSTSYNSFLQQVEAARASRRFVQFSTMFVHHYRVQRFLDCVWPRYNKCFAGQYGQPGQYGHHGHHVHLVRRGHHGNGGGDNDSIESMYALLTINVLDLDKLGGPTTTIFPFIKPGDGCLRRLARYCVLTALLLMQQAPDKHNKKKKNDDDCQDVVLPISVQCTKATSSSSSSSSSSDNIKGEPISASGIVKFAHGRTLTFDVAYSSAPTRQVLKVEGRHRYATMTDFVIPHPDGLSTYRLYDKKTTTKKAKTSSSSASASAVVDAKTNTNTTTSTPAAACNDAPRPWRHADLEIVKGQALDVPSGPPQDVMMWRRFASACRSVQQQQKGDGSDSAVAAAATAAVGVGGGREDDDDNKIANANANGRQTARNFTQVAMHLKRILKALDESYYANFIEIALDDISK